MKAESDLEFDLMREKLGSSRIKQRYSINPKRILVITMRYLGDALLVTPLLSSLKHAYPSARIDLLTTESNQGVFEGNADINKLICFKKNASFFEKTLFYSSIFRKYDIALSTQSSDRCTFIALFSGKMSLGLIAGRDYWKRWLLSHTLLESATNHKLLENLRFCEVLNIKKIYQPTPPCPAYAFMSLKPKTYVVLHIYPQWQYKQWVEGAWQNIIRFFVNNKLTVILSGAEPEQEALEVLRKPFSSGSVRNLAGKLTLGQLSETIRGALLFIGPDTGVTHLASATGVPTIALFGPTDPRVWGPWPWEYQDNHSPYEKTGSQKIKNVFLLQGESEKRCVPCQQEGCDKHRLSASQCLQNLPAHQVINAIKEALHESSFAVNVSPRL